MSKTAPEILQYEIAPTCKDYLQVRAEGNRARRVLPNAGSISKKTAEEHARQEYERFAERRQEYMEALGEGESIKALEEAAKLVGRGKKVEGGE